MALDTEVNSPFLVLGAVRGGQSAVQKKKQQTIWYQQKAVHFPAQDLIIDYIYLEQNLKSEARPE